MDGVAWHPPIKILVAVSTTRRGYTLAMKDAILDVIHELSPPQRLELIELLWDSLNEAHEPMLAGEQVAELDSRLGATETGELKTVTLEAFLTRFRNGGSP